MPTDKGYFLILALAMAFTFSWTVPHMSKWGEESFLIPSELRPTNVDSE